VYWNFVVAGDTRKPNALRCAWESSAQYAFMGSQNGHGTLQNCLQTIFPPTAALVSKLVDLLWLGRHRDCRPISVTVRGR
jgi:hypothetical protein